MAGAELVIELLLRGAATGALALLAVSLLRAGVSQAMRVAGLLFCLSTIAYAWNSAPAIRDTLGPALAPLHFLTLGGGGFFWLFIVTLFEDEPIDAARLAPAGALTLIGLFGLAAPDPSALRAGIWIAHNLIELGLAIHALLVIHRSWRGDLVEARRRLRGPFLGAVSAYVITLSAFEIGESLGISADWYPLAGAAALALFSLVGTAAFLEARTALFGAARGRETPEEAADAQALARLKAAMETNALWRQEGLTIAALANEVGVPEYRVRRLINDHLGARNFAAFVNGYRIAAAKRILSDPAQARINVATIAFDLGFGSLGPFNRAFKEATGLTPTQFRRDPGAAAAPKPEIPG